MTDTERRKEDAVEDARFEREEMGELLKLFSALGITVAAGIVGFFLLGVWAEKWIGGAGRIIGLVLGLGLGVGWGYLRIARHLNKYGRRPGGK